jgi:hypothetical protein
MWDYACIQYTLAPAGVLSIFSEICEVGSNREISKKFAMFHRAVGEA